MTSSIALPPRPDGVPVPDRSGSGGFRRWSSISAVLGVVAIVLLGVVVVRVLGASSGAGTPEEAVEDFLNGIASEDGVTAIDAVNPGEVRGADAFYEAVETRLEALGAETGDLAGDGLSFEIRGLELETDDVGTEVALVDVVGGEVVVSRTDGELLEGSTLETLLLFSEGLDSYGDDSGDDSGEGSEEGSEEPEPRREVAIELEDLFTAVLFPFVAFGSLVALEAEGYESDIVYDESSRPESEGDAYEEETYDEEVYDEEVYDEEAYEEDYDLPEVATRFVTVRGDGAWHVSLLGTAADVWSQVAESETPDYAAIDAALSADPDERAVGETPDDAIRLLVESYNDGEVTGILDALPADLAASLYAFAPVLQDLADSEEVAADLEVTELETSEVSSSGDLVRVRIDQMSVEGSVSDSSGSQDAAFGIDGGCLTDEAGEECLPDDFVEATGIDSFVLTVVEVDGGYQVDPVATLYDNLTDAVSAIPDSYLADLLGVTTYGERQSIAPGETTVELDETGAALLEIDAEAGQILSLSVDAELETLDFYAPDSTEADWETNSAVYGQWGEAEPVVGAYAVQAAGAQLVHLRASDDTASVTVTVNLDDDVPNVGVGDEVALQHGTYGVAGLAGAFLDSVWVQGPGSQSFCWEDGCTALVVAGGPGVSLTDEEYDDEEGAYSDFQYRGDDAYDVEPYAEAALTGGEDDGSSLEVGLVDGVAEGELVVTEAGWVLLDAIVYAEEADIAVEIRNAADEVVCSGDVNPEYGDEWCDAELAVGTYQVRVTDRHGTTDEYGVDLYLN